MGVLNDALFRFFARFGRPAPSVGSAEHDDRVDGRLTELERKQLEIRARLSILEKSGNPRGIGRD